MSKELGTNPIVEHIKVLSNDLGEFSYLRYFGEFLLFVDILMDNSCPTAGVTVTKTNPLLVYNEKFVKDLSKHSLSFLLIHEVFHLLSGHNKRFVDGNMEHQLANVAADMIINESICNTIIDKTFEAKAPIIKSALRKPKKYSGRMILEDLYVWVKEMQDDYNKTMDKVKGQGQSGQSQSGPGQGQPGDGQPQPGDGQGTNDKDSKSGKDKNGKGKGSGKSKEERDLEGRIGKDMKQIFDGLEAGKPMTLDKHMLDAIPDEMKQEIVDAIETNLRNRGLETGDIASTLRNLKKSKTDYTKKILSTLERGFGIKNTKSFRRPNRRGIQGLKGPDSEFKALNVLLDTSGSMCGYWEKALSFIFRNEITINLIQCDTKVHDAMEIGSLLDFKKVIIKGQGGTMMQPGITHIEKNKKINRNNLLILTDGYTDSLRFTSKTKKVLILSNAEKCSISSAPRTKVQQIVIKNFDEK